MDQLFAPQTCTSAMTSGDPRGNHRRSRSFDSDIEDGDHPCSQRPRTDQQLKENFENPFDGLDDEHDRTLEDSNRPMDADEKSAALLTSMAAVVQGQQRIIQATQSDTHIGTGMSHENVVCTWDYPSKFKELVRQIGRELMSQGDVQLYLQDHHKRSLFCLT
ncbi:hypothetical protein KEM48_014200 [Puccinia striiformis f. sp. tritici PST-130]|nr:hypothetical protein KEM48_014200 [Puccinia striiformis f. sp. tritici PST-130]